MTATEPTDRLYHYRARYVSNYDGDTVRLDLDLGCGVWRHSEPLRLARVDCPEMNAQDAAVREAAVRARDFVRTRLIEAGEIVVETVKDRREKFGRLLAEVWHRPMGGSEWSHLNDELLAGGLAVPAPW